MSKSLSENDFVRGWVLKGGVAAPRRRGVAAPAALMLLTAVLLLAGCGDMADDEEGNSNGSRPQAARKSDEGSITASPNPVPAGEGNGRTTITWNTKGGLGDVKVYVSSDGVTEALFSHSTGTSVEAPWIESGKTYEFRLYSEMGGNRRLIDKVEVRRAQ